MNTASMENINIGGWFFDLSNPWLILVAGLLLLSLLFTLAACWRRLYPRWPARALLVALLNMLAFIAVLGLLTGPQSGQLLQQNVTLLTEGADTHSTGLFDGPLVYVSEGVTATAEARRNLKNAHWLLDVAQLKLRQPALAGMDVKGYGLTELQWQDFPASINVSFDPPAISGFTQMHWPKRLLSGKALLVSGRYTHRPGDQEAGDQDADGATTDQTTTDQIIINLALLDPVGNIVNETRIRNGAYFSLAARPKARGNLEYTLKASSGDKLLSEELVSTYVGSAKHINIMVQQSAPSFETRQLKNFAAGNGASVLINTQISRGKSISQSSNLPDGADINFSPLSLAAQDVLIMDGRALVQLATLELQWLDDAVKHGLGLLVLADTSLLEERGQLYAGLLAGFELSANPETKIERVPRLISQAATGWQQPLPVASMQLQATGADVLIDAGQGNALVVSQAYGLGQVAISLISQSHRWLTGGQRAQWSEYWAALIGATGKVREHSYLLAQPDTAFFEVGQRIPVCAMAASDDLLVTITPVSATAGQAFEIPLTADVLGSPRRCGWYWAQHSGWHQLLLHAPEQPAPLDQQGVYIQKPDQWLAHKRQQRVNASGQRSANSARDTTAAQAGTWVAVPINTTWLWLLLVISASLLWLERKLDFEW